MKKSIVFIICLLLLTACGQSKTKDGKIIATSNDSSNTKLQIKIVSDYINIRKEKSVESDIIGIVKKGSVFDVVDHEQVGKYHWVHIITNNKLDGYVASFEDNIYYEFVNGDIDFIEPKLEVNVGKITVDSYSEITDEYVKSIVTYSDDKDENPVLTYDVSQAGYGYYLNIKVTDAGGNETEQRIDLKVNNERLASNGQWLTQDQIRDLRKKFLNIIRKYGTADEYSCLTNTYWKMDFYNKVTISVFDDVAWLYGCTFVGQDKEIKVGNCNDSAGTVSYEEMHKRISKQEQSAKDVYLKIVEDIEQIGYKISDVALYIN